MSELIPTNDEIRAIEIMSKHAQESKFFNNLNGYGGIFSIAMFARELGLPVMQCLFGGMTNIQGKIEIAPRMMNAMIRKAGHQINIIKSDDEICTLKGVRKDTNETYECSYAIGDATKAGLTQKQNYKNYASDMLFARCLSRLARRLFADVIGSAYVEGEIEKSPLPTSANSMEEVYDEKNTVALPGPTMAERARNIEKTPAVPVPKTEITEEEWARLDLLLMEVKNPTYLEQLCTFLKITDIHNIDPKHYNAVIKSLENQVNPTGGTYERAGVASVA